MIRIAPRFAAIAAVAVVLPAVAGCGYNTIPTKQERAQAAWADVQSQYQRRADLIPNLVATVQGAAIQERTTLTQVIEARNQAAATPLTTEQLSDPNAVQAFANAQGRVTAGIRSVELLVEAYPQLRSNENCSSSSRNWKAQRTASPSPGATITRRCATIILPCAPSPA